MPIQLRVIKDKVILAEGNMKRGDVLWASPARARHLLENGICSYITGATVVKPAGPSEIKPAGPSILKDDAPRKSSGEVMRSPLIASPLSRRPGRAKRLFA